MQRRLFFASGGMGEENMNRLIEHRFSPGIRLSILFLAGLCVSLTGCGKGASSGTGTPIIATALAQAPPMTLLVGATATLSATVTDDTAMAGVNWTVTCSAANCGSFSATHTPSGFPTVFTAPAISTMVTIMASSVTDASKTAMAVVTIGSPSFSQAPPQSLLVNGTAGVAATLPADPTGAGLLWTVTCGSPGACGSVSPVQTPSGTPTVYTAPASMPIGAQVTITATSAVDSTATISQAITIVTSNIAISLSFPGNSAAPIPIVINNMSLLTAAVANDPLNSGVDWKLSCNGPGAGGCGTLMPSLVVMDTTTTKSTSIAHTDNGQPVAYLAPSTLIAGASATITASSRTDNTVTTFAMITVSPVTANGLLAGQFAFLISGRDTNGGNQYVMGGSFVGDGQGHVVTGEADVIDSANPATAGAQASTPLTGAYTMGADGRGQIILNTTGLNSFGISGQVTLSVAFVSQIPLAMDAAMRAVPQNRALLSETDGFGNGTGTLYLQNLGDVALANSSGVLPLLQPTQMQQCVAPFTNPSSPSPINGPCPPGLPLGGLPIFFFGAAPPYVLALTGAHASDASMLSYLTGALVPGTVPGGPAPGVPPTGTPLGQFVESGFLGDAFDAGVLTTMAIATTTQQTTGTAPDTLGRLQFQGVDVGALVFASGSTSITTLNAYMVDRDHYIVLQGGDPNFTLAGTLVASFDQFVPGQNAPHAISGTTSFAFTEAGTTNGSPQVPQVAGGIFMCDLSGNPTSVLDVNPLGGTAIPNQAVNVMCADPSSNGRGTITLTTTGGISQFAAYPTTDEGGSFLQLIEIDAGGPAGSGFALPQTPPTPPAGSPTFPAALLSGKYAGNFIANTPQGLEGFSGQIISDGISAVSGSLDVNSVNVTANPVLATPSAGTALSGSYAVPANSPGRFPLVLNISTPAPQSINPVCYIVDENTCLLLGLDTTTPGIGILQLQNLGF